MRDCGSGVLRPCKNGCSDARIVKFGVGLEKGHSILICSVTSGRKLPLSIILFYLLSDADRPFPVGLC